RRIADGCHRAGRRGGQATHARFPRRPRRQGSQGRMTQPRYRDATIGACRAASMERRGDGSIVLRSPVALAPFANTLIESLEHWATTAPERTFVAKRIDGGEWKRLTYAEMRRNARAVGSALVARGLSADRPVAILSENDLEHLTLMFGAMY